MCTKCQVLEKAHNICFINIISLNPHTLNEVEITLFPFYRGGKWGSARLWYDLPNNSRPKFFSPCPLAPLGPLLLGWRVTNYRYYK